MRRFEYSSRSSSPLNTIASLLVFFLVLIGLFYLAKLVFKLLWFVAPLIFIASLIIDHRVFLDFAYWLGGLVKRNALLGIGAIVLSLIAFPLVAVFLLGKALLKKKVNDLKTAADQRREGERADYEIIDSELVDDDDPLDLPRQRQRPEIEIRPRQDRQDSDYNQFFK